MNGALKYKGIQRNGTFLALWMREIEGLEFHVLVKGKRRKFWT